MKQQSRLRTKLEANSIAAAQIETLVVSLGRGVSLLNNAIQAEEERTGCNNCSNPSYSSLARTLIARRDNLDATIAALRERLATLDTDVLLSAPRWSYGGNHSSA